MTNPLTGKNIHPIDIGVLVAAVALAAFGNYVGAVSLAAGYFITDTLIQATKK